MMNQEALKIATKIIRQFEGCKLQAYQDIVGVYTIGWGETKGIKEGMKWTQEQADKALEERVEEFMEAILKASPKLAKYTPEALAAITSLSYNIGQNAYKNSTVAKRISEENWPAAADAILMWNQAGGKVVQGLVNRRKAERDLFLSKRG